MLTTAQRRRREGQDLMSFSNFDERAQSADFWQDQEVLTKILEQEEGVRESIQNRQTERHKAMPLKAAVYNFQVQTAE
jgi:hypothetical protein